MTDKRRMPDKLRAPRPGAVHKPPNAKWKAWIKEIEAFYERPICGAKTKAGHPCPRGRMLGRTRCLKHGGRTPRGPASPHYIDGRADFISKVLPRSMRESFRTSLQDENLLELRAEIALCDSQLSDLLRRARKGATTSAWEYVEYIRGEMAAAMAEGKNERVKELMDEWRTVMETPGDDPILRAEIRKTMDLRRKLVRGEQLRLEALQGYITNEKMLQFISHVVDTLVKYVPREYLAKPIEELGHYIPTSQRIPAILPGREED